MKFPVIQGEEHPWPVMSMNGRAVEFLTHQLIEKSTGRKATLIATIHTALRKYYSVLQQKIDSTPGIIYEEGIHIDFQKPRTPEENFLIGFIRESCLEIVKSAQSLGLDIGYQKLELRLPPERTKNVDISLDEFVTELKKRDYNFSQLAWAQKEILFYQSERELLAQGAGNGKDLLRRIVHWMESQMKVDFKDDTSALNDVIMDFREQRVLKDIFETQDDVVIPWGAAHIQNFSDALVQSGKWIFDEESIHYDQVYEYPKD